MLTRKKTPQKVELNWFEFSCSLFHKVCSDYISLRLLYYLEPLTTGWTILPKMVEVAEKSLKLFVTVNKKSDKALSEAGKYGHNVEELRKVSCAFNLVFNDEDIKHFTKDLCEAGGELYQYLRYGSQKTTEGMTSNLEILIPVIDKIFFKSLLLLPEGEKRVINFSGTLKFLVTGSKFDQSQNRDLLLAALKRNNQYIEEYVQYCVWLDAENKKLNESFKIDVKPATE